MIRVEDLFVVQALSDALWIDALSVQLAYESMRPVVQACVTQRLRAVRPHDACAYLRTVLGTTPTGCAQSWAGSAAPPLGQRLLRIFGLDGSGQGAHWMNRQ